MLAIGLAASLLVAQEPPSQASFPELNLTLTLPALDGLERGDRADDEVRGSWSGKLGSSQLSIALYTFPLDEWEFHEAGGVTNVMLDWLRERGDFDVDESFEREGKYGAAPVLSVVSGRIREGSQVIGREYAASGLLAEHGYTIHVRAQPEPDEPGKQRLLEFFASGIVYGGAARDPAWTEAELRARWLKDAPDDLHADFERNLSKKAWVKNAILRTEHYLVLTNASGGKKFAEQMEKNYAQIGKVFPLPPSKGCRLMPVFLFQTPEQYYDFCEKRGMDREGAERSAGHASGDYYATWYEAPTDPTHIHEQVHQIFENRLFLQGGGSWFQEGVAEYIETSRNDRNVVASQVEKGRHLALVEFFQRESLLWSSSEERKEGGSEASDLYNQAGLFIEFLRESPWSKEKFAQFLETVGRVPQDLAKLRAAFREVFGEDVEAIDARFQAYCAKR